MRLDSMRDLLISEIADLSDARRQLTEALPELERAASSDDLRKTFSRVRDENSKQLDRAATALNRLHGPVEPRTCKAMQGLVREAREIIQSEGDSLVRDAALVAAAQRIEHYEIAGYGTAMAFAKQLGDKELVKLLKPGLDEAKKFDKQLTKLAEGSLFKQGINPAAKKRTPEKRK